ncbi:MAG TPA: OmpA family protein [Micromonosporaceae bacterium]|jgi:outer membrane protein OmpA-like peptidoglycan-associated protein|nr:OmpA family protein [Micromonosporaceae bacterium]
MPSAEPRRHGDAVERGRRSARWRRLALPIGVGVLGLISLGIVQDLPIRHGVEKHLTNDSVQALDGAGIRDVSVRFSGRDATVYVRSASDGERALAIVRSQPGVRVARVVFDRKPSAAAAPPSAPPSARANLPGDAGRQPQAPGSSNGARANDRARVQVALDALGPVYFTSGSAALTAAGRATVTKVAAVLRAAPTVRIEVRGFADSSGPAATNDSVSRDRAATVSRALLALGVPATRLTVVGFGETQPAASNDTPAHRALNRRVDFVVR